MTAESSKSHEGSGAAPAAAADRAPSPGSAAPIDTGDTGDTVLHRPSGERWVVAYVTRDGERLTCLGWPETMARTADCELVERADAGQRAALLRGMADLEDSRGVYARNELRRLAQAAG